ncbi:MAG TPA: murein biosynthesis integral membrane protein MurJ [Nocardioidaceae bacterium]|nr:murein biosynthesis integral membrane protein MurJ [Nocardioidaceae bacterium]
MTGGPDPDSEGSPERDRSRLLSAGALMAAGTIVSRLTGFVRSALLLAVLGKSLDADIFATANTLPNSMYILVAGGVFNVVLVPQLVRAMRSDADGGEAFAERLLSLGVLVLVGATAALTALVPVLAHVIFSAELFTAELAAQRESAYALMFWCMPQVFFYGVFVLVGQVLNARERFGPMMWAPIVNNVVACAALGTYAAIWGTSDGSGGFTTAQEVLLGASATVGIAVQALVLVPYARSAGFTFRFRRDLRGVGLGRTLRLGSWTIAFVIASQVSFVVVTRLATGSSTEAALTGGGSNGVAVYQGAFLVTQVPHAIITVSLVTATMPLLSRLAVDGDTARMRDELRSTLRLVLVAIVPMALALGCLGSTLAAVLFSYGALDGGTAPIGWTLMAFAPGLVLFTVHYLMLRGFYAREDTRTPFLVQLVVSGSNIAAAIALTRDAPTDQIATRLALAYGIAYLFGSVASTLVLSRRIGGLGDRTLIAFAARLTCACAASALVMLGLPLLLAHVGVEGDGAGAAVVVLVGAGGIGALTYLVAAALLGLREVRALLTAVTRR